MTLIAISLGAALGLAYFTLSLYAETPTERYLRLAEGVAMTGVGLAVALAC